MYNLPTLQQPSSAAGATPGRQKTLTTMICTIPTSKLSMAKSPVADAAVTTTQVGTKNIGIAGLSSFAIISFADLVIY